MVGTEVPLHVEEAESPAALGLRGWKPQLSKFWRMLESCLPSVHVERPEKMGFDATKGRQKQLWWGEYTQPGRHPEQASYRTRANTGNGASSLLGSASWLWIPVKVTG